MYVKGVVDGGYGRDEVTGNVWLDMGGIGGEGVFR